SAIDVLSTFSRRSRRMLASEQQRTYLTPEVSLRRNIVSHSALIQVRPSMATATLPPLAGPTRRARMEDGIVYQRIVVVGLAGDGADRRANGAALRQTLAGIAASAAERCLLALAAGVYDLGVEPLHMKAHVDIEGAGEQL